MLGWEADWVKTAENLVRAEYVSTYEDAVESKDVATDTTVRLTTAYLVSQL